MDKIQTQKVLENILISKDLFMVILDLLLKTITFIFHKDKNYQNRKIYFNHNDV